MQPFTTVYEVNIGIVFKYSVFFVVQVFPYTCHRPQGAGATEPAMLASCAEVSVGN